MKTKTVANEIICTLYLFAIIANTMYIAGNMISHAGKIAGWEFLHAFVIAVCIPPALAAWRRSQEDDQKR